MASSAAAPSLVIKMLALGGGAFLVAAGVIAGVLLGTRQLKGQARSLKELLALKQFEFTSVTLVVLAAVLFPLSWQLTRQPWSQVATFAGFIVRLEMEALEDPVRAARARAMERRAAILGWTLGLTFGTLGLIAGLMLAAD